MKMTTNRNGNDEESVPATCDVPPLKRDIRSPGAWKYLVNYILLGSSAVIILMEIIESGVWRSLGIPLLLIVVAIMNLARLQVAERNPAEPPAPGDADKPRP
jgi:hypothetical protein